MPANLSPEYYEADQRYRRADSDQERLAALQEMLSAIPKHKGTEKMQADIKSRIAKLRKEASKSKGGAKRFDPAHVPREGAGQVVLLGAPNAGKSALVAASTNAEPEVADYPFTTRKAQPAMMPFENIQIQLVDTPAISREFTESWIPQLVRVADFACLLASAGDDACLENVDAVLEILEERNVRLVQEPDPEASILARVVDVPTLLVATQTDRPGAPGRVDILREFYGDRFEILEISTEDPASIDALRRRLFDALGVIRVCSKAPGKPADSNRPFILPQGATVIDFARAVHKDFADKLQFARSWGEGKFDGQRVPRDHPLADMDIIELHT